MTQEMRTACRSLHAAWRIQVLSDLAQAPDYGEAGSAAAYQRKSAHRASCSWGEPTAEDQERMLPSAAMLTMRLHAGARATTPACTIKKTTVGG